MEDKLVEFSTLRDLGIRSDLEWKINQVVRYFFWKENLGWYDYSKSSEENYKTSPYRKYDEWYKKNVERIVGIL